jgi:hypothetical protein
MREDENGSPKPAGRSLVPEREVEIKTHPGVHYDLGKNRAAIRVFTGFSVLFVGVFITDIAMTSKYWKDLRDATDGFTPFIGILTTAFAGAAGYFFGKTKEQ